jgi:hypothetical protein
VAQSRRFPQYRSPAILPAPSPCQVRIACIVSPLAISLAAPSCFRLPPLAWPCACSTQPGICVCVSAASLSLSRGSLSPRHCNMVYGPPASRTHEQHIALTRLMRLSKIEREYAERCAADSAIVTTNSGARSRRNIKSSNSRTCVYCGCDTAIHHVTRLMFGAIQFLHVSVCSFACSDEVLLDVWCNPASTEFVGFLQ